MCVGEGMLSEEKRELAEDEIGQLIFQFSN